MACGLYYEIYRHSFRLGASGGGTGREKDRERERATTVAGTSRAVQTQLTAAQNYKRNADALTVIARQDLAATGAAPGGMAN